MKYKGGIFDEREGSFHPVISAASGQTVSTLLLLLLVHYFFFSSPVSYNFLETTSTKQHASTPACVLLCVEVVRQKIPSPFFFRKEQLSAAGCNWLLHCCVARCLDRWYTFRTLFVFYFYFPTILK
jgi:hypothetical protein